MSASTTGCKPYLAPQRTDRDRGLWKPTRCGCSIKSSPGGREGLDQIPPVATPSLASGRRLPARAAAGHRQPALLKLSGAGPGTVIRADGFERALVFEQCAAVRLSDLAYGPGRSARGNVAHIGGALTLTNCPQVAVESWPRMRRRQHADAVAARSQLPDGRQCRRFVGGPGAMRSCSQTWPPTGRHAARQRERAQIEDNI
jgi:hypothetical protein